MTRFYRIYLVSIHFSVSTLKRFTALLLPLTLLKILIFVFVGIFLSEVGQPKLPEYRVFPKCIILSSFCDYIMNMYVYNPFSKVAFAIDMKAHILHGSPLVQMEKGEFDAVEYSVFGVMMALSVVIGVYFGFYKGGQHTVEQYLLGGKNMGLLPISVSLICSFISGVTLLGTPTEVYTYGTQHMMIGVSFISSAIVVIYFILPVLYKLQMFSVFEYLERRFDARVRRVTSFLYTLYLILYVPIVIYGPALALNQVSGLPVHLVTMSVSIVCILYTTVGGFKAVVWADTLQGIVMCMATVIVAVVATIELGGISVILKAAEDSDRLELFQMQFDPRHRNTFWTVSLGFWVILTSFLSTDPIYMQRFIALPSLRKAQWSVLYWGIGCFFFVFFSGYLGLCAYAKFKYCDPMLSGVTQRPDQILPLLIVEVVVGKVRGLPGLFLAGIVCAALSSMSTCINTVSGTIYADFLEPCFGNTTEKKASNIMKILSLVFGIISAAMVLLIEQLGTILEVAYAFNGMIIGTMLGVFILGLFFPSANNKGAAVGVVFSLLTMTWIITGANYAIKTGELVYGTKPVSVEGCNKTINISSTLTEEDFSHAFPLFAISVYYYAPLGALLVILVGVPLSYLTGPNRPQDVNRDLLSPLIYRYLPTYSNVPTKEIELREM